MFKVTTKTPERCQWHRSGVFTFSFEHISHLVLVFLMLTLNWYILAVLFALVHSLLMLNPLLYVTCQNLLKSSDNLNHILFDDFSGSRS